MQRGKQIHYPPYQRGAWEGAKSVNYVKYKANMYYIYDAL